MSWTARLERELFEYMKNFSFDSPSDRNTLYQFYKDFILARRWESIYGFEDISEKRWKKVCYLDAFNELAIIPLLPSLSRKVAATKSFGYDKIGWNFLARLFEEWLVQPFYIRSGKEFEYPGPVVIADSIMKDGTVPGMEWVLKYKLAKDAFNEIITTDSFSTTNFLDRLADLFFSDNTLVHAAKNRFWMGACSEQGNYQQEIALKHAHYVQTKKVVDNSLGTLAGLWWNGAESATGLDAALHGFAFHALLGGEITAVNDKTIDIAIDTLAVYYKDSFDFTGEQDLGSWRFFGSNKIISLTNGSFGRYRTLKMVGRDFYIFSKNKIVLPQERGWNVLHYRLTNGKKPTAKFTGYD